MDAIEIRKLTSDDVDAYREIRLEGLRVAQEAFGSTLQRELDFPTTRFVDMLTNGNVIGAFDSGSLCGVLGQYFGSGKRAHIGTLWGTFVREGWRGRGIGRRLIEAQITLARECGAEIVHITYVVGNDGAGKLYESAGFERYGVEKNALKFDGRYYDEVLMTFDLSVR